MFKRIFDKLYFLINNLDSAVVLTFVFFLINIFIVKDNAGFYISCSLLISILYFVTKSLEKTILFSFLPLFIFRAEGQLYATQVIELDKIRAFFHLAKENIYFTFSPYIMLFPTIVYGIICQFFQLKNKKNFVYIYLLFFILFCLSIISSSRSEFVPGFSILSTITNFEIVFWAIFTYLFFQNNSKEMNKKLLKILLIQLVLIFLLEAFIVFWQLSINSTIGLLIERSENLILSGSSPDELNIRSRPIGLESHPNLLANFILDLAFSILLVFVYLQKKVAKLKNIFYIFFVFVLVALIVVTQSRAAYISVFISLTLLQYIFKVVNPNELKKQFKFFIKRRVILIVVLLLVAFLGNILITRLINSIYSFNLNGGWKSRIEMYQDSLKIIGRHPLIGVGTRNYVPAVFYEIGSEKIKNFPYEVHNNFLLMASEEGLLSLLIFIVLCSFLIQKISLIYNKTNSAIYKLFIIGLISNGVLWTFHAMDFIFPLNLIFGSFLIFSEKISTYEKK